MPGPSDQLDIAVIGAGAAGLMASIAAGRAGRGVRCGVGCGPGTGRPLRIAAFDGSPRVGVKILVAGGGRCNVTHHAVTHEAYAGGSANAIRSVLRRFGVEDTVAFFRDLGVRLKREDTGKLFPTTDDARTVLDALLRAVDEAGAELRFPARVTQIGREGGGFVLGGDWGRVRARRVILATGGRALPRSGSDGGGYALAESLGHTVTARVFPALVPLVLDAGSALRSLSGLTLPARLELRSGTGKRLKSFTDSTLCTHFGLSGPSAMDMSRYLTAARFDDRGAHVVACWLPDASRDNADRELQDLGRRSVSRWVRERLPERMAVVVLEESGVDPATTGAITGAITGATLSRDRRRALLDALFEMPLPVTGDRGFTHAETTAGGVPLDEISMKTMASKRCDGLFVCGEICDVDGRIGGFNFQWAWASGHIAGTAAAASLGDGAGAGAGAGRVPGAA